MVDRNNPIQDDLRDFSDYLAEFDSLINFDDETCPVCGINISNSVSLQNSPFVEYKTVKNESDLIPIINELELNIIRYKIEKHLDSTTTSEINYKFIVLIPFNCLDKINKEKA